MKRLRSSAKIVLSLILAMSLGSCSYCSDNSSARGEPGPAGLSAEKKRPERVLTIGIQQEPDSLWPGFSTMFVAQEVSGAGSISLCIRDDKGHLQPSAAQKIPTQKNQGVQLLKDGRMRVVWNLDPNLFWPDGQQVRAEDFVFTYDLLKNPLYPSVDRSVLEKIDKMYASGDDKSQLVVEWKHPYPYYARYGLHPVLPRHLLEQRYKKAPKKLLSDVFSELPTLAGPFTVAEWIHGSHIILKRNPAARGKWKPWFDRIIFRIIPSTTALEANLRSGTIDAISAWLPQDRFQELREKHGKDFKFYLSDGLLFEHIDCNMQNPILQDLRVRRALMYGLDRGKILHKLFGNQVQVAQSWLPPRRPAHNPDLRRYDYNPDKAKALLTEAGWILNAQGQRVKDGQVLQLTIQAPSGNSARELIEQALQKSWAKIGIQLEIENQPGQVFFSETLRKRKFSGLAMYTWALDAEGDSGDLWRCDRIPSESNGWQGQNYSGWCNQEVTGLHQDLESELDPDRSHSLLMRQQMLWAEALPVLPLYFKLEPSITTRRLRGWKPTGSAVPVSWNAAEWKFVD